MEWQCHQYHETPFRCGESQFCTFRQEVCDGVANCPMGEDEGLKQCTDLGKFSDLASKTCVKRNTYNATITIKAVPCNGIKECEDGSDEDNCSAPNWILPVLFALSISILTILSFFVWKSMIHNLSRLPKAAVLPDFESLHGKDDMKSVMFQAQRQENFEDFNNEFLKTEMKIHDNVLEEVICCIKVGSILQTSIFEKYSETVLPLQNSLDSATAATIMRNFPTKRVSLIEKYFSGILKKADR